MSMLVRRRQWIALAFLLGVMLAVYLPVTPALRPIPPRDSGIFLYTGQQINAGYRLYDQIWDHKPPIIYYLNSLGLRLAGGSMWGVYALEALFLLGAVIVSFITLRRAFGFGAALVGTFAWILGLVYLLTGNQLEEYVLLFQFAALYFFLRAVETGRARWGAPIGIVMSLAFFTRQNSIAIGLAAGVYLLICFLLRGRRTNADAQMMTMAIGSLIVTASIIAIMGVAGLLRGMWEVGFVYNFTYSGATLQDKLASILYGLDSLKETGLPVLAAGGWLLGALTLVATRRQPQAISPLLVVALLAMPLELIFASLSGRQYEHYYVTVLPVFAVLVAALVSAILNTVRAASERGRLASAAWVVGLVGALALFPGVKLGQQYDQLLPLPENPLQQRVITFLRENTSETDTVLMWGGAPGINFLAERRAPTRFAILSPLYMPRFQGEALYLDFVTELETNRPRYIIDTSGTDPGVAPLDAARRAAWLQQIEPLTGPAWDAVNVPPEMDIVFNYIATQYERIGTFGEVWDLYQWRGL